MTASALYHEHLHGFQQELQAAIEGESDFSAAGVALYTSDASNYRQIPLCAVFPKSIDDIVATTTLCRQHGLSVLMRGGGTSQNGQTVNESVILDCSRHLRRVLDIDVDKREALIEPGIICDSLKAEAERYGLTFGPDPATHSRCTLGGMIGNNSCGPHSMLAGKTVENVVELEVLTPSGERFWVGPTSDDELASILSEDNEQAKIYEALAAIRDEYAELIRERYPDIKRRVSGYNLDQLLPENQFNVARALVGTEGTCVSVLQARVKLIENPKYKRLIVLGFDDIFSAGDMVPDIMPFKPIAMEGLDWAIIGGLIDRNLKQAEVALLPEGKAWLLIELAASTEEALDEHCQSFADAMARSSRVKTVLPVPEADKTTAIWSIREQGASATAMSLNPEDPDPVVGWEDTAVDPMRLGDYLRRFYALVDEYGYKTSMYGHFGDGCIHARMTFDTRSEEGVEHWRRFSVALAKLVVEFGGSLSGEHGDGQAKAEFLPIMFGEELMDAFRRFKQAWDPDKRMNPGKVIDAYRMDENLRFSPQYNTPSVTTRLSFHEDLGGFGRTTERCIGMGKCRALSGAMCPSYQVTGDERYSTRGRAHLLHELLRGEVITDSWQNTDVADSLEHCLSCKACRSECPTHVDIATYKSEFMSRHYQHHRRPMYHRFFGHIGTLLPTLARFSALVNPLQKNITGRLGKKLLGIDGDRQLPEIAKETFAVWAKQNADDQDDFCYWYGDQSLPATVLWADTFNSHYRPQVLQSAVRVLNKAGFRAGVARQHFCCGRPLYEYGYLDQAEKQLRSILDNFQTQLPADAPVIVVEPACLSVFRDELVRMIADDDRATDLAKRTVSLTDHLTANDITISTTLPSGLLHRHCHDKSLSIATQDLAWMKQCFDSIEEPEQGCCGMAGSFGMRQKTGWIGRKLFERKLAPSIAKADSQTVIVANGFSCHEQIGSSTERRALHPVEVIEQCL
jgi:FAD/FMN-containing dehydrogenase/Fe-S oxidoreductase